VPLGPHRFKWAETVDEDDARVRAALDAVADRVIRSEGRVVLMGFSQGGQMAAALAARHPDAYAGAIVMSPGTVSELALEHIEGKRRLDDRRFVVVVGAEEHPGNVAVAAADANQLRTAGADVLHKAYAGMRTHAFPPDFDDALPHWVRFILGTEKKP
jgi:predicted esterase